MKKRGFTLIEILIAIAIIGILASVIAFVLVVIKQRSADTRRVSDINQIAKALELYYDKNAEYPGELEDLVVEGFLPVVPLPPKGGAQVFYAYVPLGQNSICTGYHLGAAMETGYRDAVKNDADAYPGAPCSEAVGLDFDGTAINCEVGIPGEGSGKGNCYDIKI